MLVKVQDARHYVNLFFLHMEDLNTVTKLCHCQWLEYVVRYHVGELLNRKKHIQLRGFQRRATTMFQPLRNLTTRDTTKTIYHKTWDNIKSRGNYLVLHPLLILILSNANQTFNIQIVFKVKQKHRLGI